MCQWLVTFKSVTVGCLAVYTFVTEAPQDSFDSLFVSIFQGVLAAMLAQRPGVTQDVETWVTPGL